MVLLVIGTILIFAFGVPLMEWLMNRIRPLTPEQEEARRFAEEARRRIDRFRR
jgi:hypothetical protein